MDSINEIQSKKTINIHQNNLNILNQELNNLIQECNTISTLEQTLENNKLLKARKSLVNCKKNQIYQENLRFDIIKSNINKLKTEMQPYINCKAKKIGTVQSTVSLST